MNGVFYVLLLFFWSTSWIAIAWQAGNVPSLVSIFYRFAFAGGIFMTALLITRRLRPSSITDHGFYILQGVLLFCLNFMGFYLATSYIASGLVALVMSSAIVMNAINSRMFYGQTLSRQIQVAIVFGLAGLCLVFMKDIAVTHDLDTIKGVALALLGTLSFSFGNMVSVRNSRKDVDLVTATAWAMCYGALATFALIQIMGFSLEWDSSLRYIGALIFLALGASIGGFTLYLRLLTKIGAAKAAYVLVVTPVIALAFSAVFEGYQWEMNTFLGFGLVMAGNVLVLRGTRRQKSRPEKFHRAAVE